MRAFFALHPPSETLAGVRAVLDRLAELPESDRLRIVPPRNLHLTLKFLGEVPLADLEAPPPAPCPAIILWCSIIDPRNIHGHP